MRSKILLTTTAAAAILAGASLASGQGASQGANEPHKGSQSSGDQGKGAEKQDKGSGHQEKSATGSQGDQGKGALSAGQQDKASGPGQQKGAAGQQGDQGKGASSAGQQDKGSTQHQQTGASGQGTTQSGDPGKGVSSAGQQGTTSPISGAETKQQSPGAQDQNEIGTQPLETTGRANANVDLSTEQRNRIRDIVLNKSYPPLSIGAVVPSCVHFARLPAPVAEIYPAWRNYDYVVVGDRILILDPVDHRIVAVLEA